MSERHKHADVIIAYAEGKKIQFRYDNSEWQDWYGIGTPSFHIDYDWRIKPAEPVVRYKWANKSSDLGVWYESAHFYSKEEICNVLGHKDMIRLDYTRTEFPREGE